MPDAIARLLRTPRWARAVRAPDPHVDRALQELGLDAGWFADHARDLAVTFAEPLLRRRQATTAAHWPEIRALYDADRLPAELEEAAAAVWSRTTGTYQHLAQRQIALRRLGWRGRRIAEFHETELNALRNAVLEEAEGLGPLAAAVDHSRDKAAWLARREALETAYTERWDAIGGILAEAWARHFGPRIYRLSRARRGPARWVLAAALGLAIVGALVFLLL